MSYLRLPHLYFLMCTRCLRSLPISSNFRAAVALESSRGSFFFFLHFLTLSAPLRSGPNIYLFANTLGISGARGIGLNLRCFAGNITLCIILPRFSGTSIMRSIFSVALPAGGGRKMEAPYFCKHFPGCARMCTCHLY